MTNDNIAVQEPTTVTKRLQAVTNTISGTSVTAEGIYLVDDAGNTIPIAENTALTGHPIPTLAAKANSIAPSWTSGNYVPLSVTTQGFLRVAQQGNIGVTAVPQGAANAGGSAANDWPVRIQGIDGQTSTYQEVATIGQQIPGVEGLAVYPLGSNGGILKQDTDNSSLVTLEDNFGSGSLVNPGDTLVQSTQGKGSLLFDVFGTFTGNPVIVFQGQAGSANWATQPVYDILNKQWITSLSPVSGQHYFLMSENGWLQFRLLMVTGVASGSVTPQFAASGQTRNISRQASAPGQPIPPEALMMAGSDGTNLQALTVNSKGQLAIQPTDGTGRIQVVDQFGYPDPWAPQAINPDPWLKAGW